MNTEPITILCVDDNPTVANSLRCIVEDEPDMTWLGHVPGADDLLERVRGFSPRILLLDLAMPGRSAFEALRELQQEAPEVRVVVLSGFANSSYIAEAMDSGAWGYVAKHEGPQVVLEAIRRVASGEVVFPGVKC